MSTPLGVGVVGVFAVTLDVLGRLEPSVGHRVVSHVGVKKRAVPVVPGDLLVKKACLVLVCGNTDDLDIVARRQPIVLLRITLLHELVRLVCADTSCECRLS